VSQPEKNDFERAADSQAERGLVAEFIEFLKHNKKWWLTPILLALLAFGALAFFAGTGAAPFIYTLF
jgi:hypothetical protein